VGTENPIPVPASAPGPGVTVCATAISQAVITSARHKPHQDLPEMLRGLRFTNRPFSPKLQENLSLPEKQPDKPDEYK
jgi:hypothetical protein